jgi:hypothetical protein
VSRCGATDHHRRHRPAVSLVSDLGHRRFNVNAAPVCLPLNRWSGGGARVRAKFGECFGVGRSSPTPPSHTCGAVLASRRAADPALGGTASAALGRCSGTLDEPTVPWSLA